MVIFPKKNAANLYKRGSSDLKNMQNQKVFSP
jgi:hypothetical protein